MNVNDIRSFQSSTARLINEGSLHDAFVAMRSFSEGGMTWEITSSIDRLEQNYAYMLRYMADGVVDPERQNIYKDIVVEARRIVDLLARRALMEATPTLYYNTARSIATRNSESLSSLYRQYQTELLRLDSDYASLANPSRTVVAEQLLRDIFNYLWTTHPLTSEDLAVISTMLESSVVPEYANASIVSAIALGALEFYDVRRLELLLRVYMSSENDEVALRALVGFFIAMFRYRRRPISRSLANIIASAKEFPYWQSDFKLATIELLRARDTERITAKLNNDLLPSLSKIMPEVNEKLKSGEIDPESIAQGEINPEWEELFNNGGLGDKLREITEIQADGGDIYMSSFGNLKQFPFFNDVANWFLPFYPSNSVVAAIDNFEGSLSGVLENIPFLCDSDKYSAILSIGTATAAQREMVTKALGAENNQMREMLSELEKASESTRRKTIINQYVRDLYRFHRLFRRKSEFFNVFDHAVDLLEIDVLADGFTDVETLVVIAEFCIKHCFWSEACNLLKKVDVLDDPDALRSQKIGFCLEQMGEFAEAISFYEVAEMLGGQGQWLMKRMASTFRRIGQHKRAVECFRRLLEDAPDDITVVLDLANTYLDAHRPMEAEKLYYQAVYLDPDSMAGQRGLAWSQFLNRKFDAADAVYAGLLGCETVVAEDYLNAGHTARAIGEIRRAIDLYHRYIVAEGGDVEALTKAFATDNRWLVDAGIDTSQNKLITESIRYTYDTEN